MDAVVSVTFRDIPTWNSQSLKHLQLFVSETFPTIWAGITLQWDFLLFFWLVPVVNCSWIPPYVQIRKRCPTVHHQSHQGWTPGWLCKVWNGTRSTSRHWMACAGLLKMIWSFIWNFQPDSFPDAHGYPIDEDFPNTLKVFMSSTQLRDALPGTRPKRPLDNGFGAPAAKFPRLGGVHRIWQLFKCACERPRFLWALFLICKVWEPWGSQINLEPH